MNKEAWDDSLLVGHLLLDGEHKHILDVLTSFINSPESENSFYSQSISVIEEAIKDHVSLHFVHEESLMFLYGYSMKEIEKHKKEHENIRAHLATFRLSLISQEPPSIQKLKTYAQEVCTEIYNHIKTLDKELWEPIHSHWAKRQKGQRRLLNF